MDKLVTNKVKYCEQNKAARMNKSPSEVADDRTLCLKIAESPLACRPYCAASKDTEPEAVFLDTPNSSSFVKREVEKDVAVKQSCHQVQNRMGSFGFGG